jgi:CO/xanthine dehydrogenase FAD-binding subunit
VSHFAKLGARRYLVISIAMAAGVLEIEAGRIAAARIAIGACSEVAQRLPDLEHALVGHAIAEDSAALVERAHLTTLRPIDDVRASAAYRIEAAEAVLRRLVGDLSKRAREADLDG